MTTAKCFSISFSVFYSHLPHTSCMESLLLGTSPSSSEHCVTKLQVTLLTEVAQKLLLLPQCFFQLETWDRPEIIPIFLCSCVNLGDSVSSLKWVWWHLPQPWTEVPALSVHSKAVSPSGAQHSQLLSSVPQPCKRNLGQRFDTAALAALSALWLPVTGCKAPGPAAVEDFCLQFPAGSLGLHCWSPPQVISSIGSMQESSLIK